MAALPPTQNQTSPQAGFFGLDLNSIGRDLLVAWRAMLNWPVVAWLWPKSDVRLWLPKGGPALSRGANAALIHDKARARAAGFEAVLLPESILLRRNVALPRLQAAEVQAALALEVGSLSPFSPDDVIWAHQMGQQNFTRLHAQVVITSRKLIAQHLESTHPQVRLQNAEIWVLGGVDAKAEPGYLALPGFGEARRQRHDSGWRWASAMLVLLALGLVAAIAATPTIRLYLKSLQANQALAIVAKKAGPVLAQRESLLRASEQVASLNKLVDKPVVPLQSLTLITQALPDDTSLLSLQIQGVKVTMTGQTVNAASLMKQLGSTAGLRDVKAPVAATKPLGAPREQFTIEFMLDPVASKGAL